MAARLSFLERELIALGLAAGKSCHAIGEELRRSASTVSREVDRNRQFWKPYVASTAQSWSEHSALRPRPGKLAVGSALRAEVAAGLNRRWSPEQIAAWLRRSFPDSPELWVSHETIYRALYVQARGSLRAELAVQPALRSRRANRRPRVARGVADTSAATWIGLRIADRPPEVDDRRVPGHWEGDLLLGRNQSAIATLVERTSRFTLLVSLPGKSSAVVVPAIAAAIVTLPEQLRRSLTWDRGGELRQHAQFTVATNCDVYFCDPQSPWQRPTNENTNGLLRQYFPKGKYDFGAASQTQLDQIAFELNSRPRKVLGWQTPAEKLNELVGATAA
jgi:IS30 family transposase